MNFAQKESSYQEERKFMNFSDLGKVDIKDDLSLVFMKLA